MRLRPCALCGYNPPAARSAAAVTFTRCACSAAPDTNQTLVPRHSPLPRPDPWHLFSRIAPRPALSPSPPRFLTGGAHGRSVPAPPRTAPNFFEFSSSIPLTALCVPRSEATSFPARTCLGRVEARPVASLFSALVPWTDAIFYSFRLSCLHPHGSRAGSFVLSGAFASAAASTRPALAPLLGGPAIFFVPVRPGHAVFFLRGALRPRRLTYGAFRYRYQAAALSSLLQTAWRGQPHGRIPGGLSARHIFLSHTGIGANNQRVN